VPVTPSSYESLRRLLTAGITTSDVAEALASLDASTDRRELRRLAASRGFEVVGVRAEGLVMGYVEPAVSDEVVLVEPGQTLPHDAPLHRLIAALDAHRRVFVTHLGGIDGIATRTDLEKPPARMWVFGIVTLIETALRGIVARRHPDDAWTALLSEARVGHARALQAERARRGEDAALLDCLQFHDLAGLAARHEDVRRTFGHTSRRSSESRLKEWARLRDHIAHSQLYVHANWDLLARIARGADGGSVARLLDMI